MLIDSHKYLAKRLLNAIKIKMEFFWETNALPCECVCAQQPHLDLVFEFEFETSFWVVSFQVWRCLCVYLSVCYTVWSIFFVDASSSHVGFNLSSQLPWPVILFESKDASHEDLPNCHSQDVVMITFLPMIVTVCYSLCYSLCYSPHG